MPARTGKTTFIPGVGSTTRGKSGAAKTFTGKGSAPSGTKKVAEPSYSEVPTVTISSSGTTTSGFSSQKAARRARKAQKRTARRVRRIVADVQRDAERRPQPPKAAPTYEAPETAYSPNPSKAVISTSPNPQAKPETFKGLKTAGTPTRKELQRAVKANALQTNAKGFVTTPEVRRAAGKVKRLEKKAKRTAGPLPGLDPEGNRVSRKVLKTGKRMGASRRELLAAAETGLVESGGFHNYLDQTETDADSLGWRQERTSLYGSDAVHPKQGARNFFTEAKSQSGATAGELAANIQRPAEQYRGRYDEVKPQANAIVRAFERGSLKPAQRQELKQARKEAAVLGLKTGGPGPAPKQVVTRYKAARSAMTELDKLNNAGKLPYVWGGGHGNASPPDCSGAVSSVLVKTHVLKPGESLVSGDMGSVLAPGPGALTVFYNGEHTFMYDAVKGEYWGTSGSNVEGGAGYFPKSVGDSQVASGAYNVGHIPGLGRKQALQMGGTIPAGEGAQPFPGMTVSSGGTTATINDGASSTKGKPGFSKKPIRLTTSQKVARTNKALNEVGVAGVGQGSRPSGGGSELARLEQKYLGAVA